MADPEYSWKWRVTMPRFALGERAAVVVAGVHTGVQAFGWPPRIARRVSLTLLPTTRSRGPCPRARCHAVAKSAATTTWMMNQR